MHIKAKTIDINFSRHTIPQLLQPLPANFWQMDVKFRMLVEDD